VVKAGQVVKVRVLEVDLPRKRISLTMKLEAPVGAARGTGGNAGSSDNKFRPAARGEQPRSRAPETGGQGAMAAAFSKLQGRR
jgi:uncharacterized protein